MIPVRLTAAQLTMLRLTTIAGECINQRQAPYRAAWIVRIDGLTHTFSEPTGDRLVTLALICRARRNGRGEASVHGRPYGQRYVPTRAGRARVAAAR